DENPSHQVARLQEARPDLQESLERGPRCSRLFLLELECCECQVSGRVVLIQPDRPLKLACRVLKSSLEHIRVCQVVMRLPVPGIRLDGGAIILHGGVHVPAALLEPSQVVESGRVVGPQLDGLEKLLACFVPIRSQAGYTKIVVGPGLARRAGHCFLPQTDSVAPDTRALSRERRAACKQGPADGGTGDSAALRAQFSGRGKNSECEYLR